MEVRPRHLEGMKALGKQIICAGGLLDEADMEKCLNKIRIRTFFAHQ